MRVYLILFLCLLSSAVSVAQHRMARVDYEAFEKLVTEVKEHRRSRLLSFEEFAVKSKEKDVIILDTRSDRMFRRKHIKGARHLDFTEFTQKNLERLIPDKNTVILIYCNNNFEDDEISFATKAYVPPGENDISKQLTLALNIPTYINLYGYGYRNIYELSELLSVFDRRVQFEGSEVRN